MSNVKDFGAAGDGKTDDTEAVRHALGAGHGILHFPRGRYRLSSTIDIPMAGKSPVVVSGDDGTATLIMAGPGPAIRLLGNHRGTGDPGSQTPVVFRAERMPVIRDLVIEGDHPEADGLELIQTVHPRLEGLLLRKLRDGIRLTRRDRNVLISNCHIYHNHGVGIFLDGVNLHQINICNNHISYNRRGGIRIERSEVRNLQITGNDIEYNNAKSHKGMESEPTAEIWVDTTAEKASVNEVTVASNTIQSTVSKGGCNIRILETPDTGRPPGLWAISGNIIGSQENNVHLTGCYGVTLSGNCIYSCGHRNLLIERSRLVSIGSNHFRRHTPRMHCGVRLVDSSDCTISACTVHDEHESGQPTGASLLELSNCERISVTGCQFLDGVPFGIDATDCRSVSLASCIVGDTRRPRKALGAIRFRGRGENNQLNGNLLDVDPTLGDKAGASIGS